MNAEHERLIMDYLGGRATEEDLRQLEQLVVGDEAFGRHLLLEASMESHLRQTLGAGALRPSLAISLPRRPQWLAIAACTVLAVIGWAVAGLYLHRSHEQSKRLVQMDQRSMEAVMRADAAEAALELALSGQPEPEVHPTVEVVDLRGWVLALPRSEQEKPITIAMGNAVPENRDLWTCPWGSVSTRYDDGTRVSLDRSTVARFNDLEAGREIRLRNGTLSVMRWPAKPGRLPLVILADSGVVTMKNGQAVVVVQKDGLLVEVAEGTVDVNAGSGTEAVTVSSGHYAVVQPNTETQVHRGRLAWQLGPVSSNGKARIE